MNIRHCRGCGAEGLIPVLDLGASPAAHAYRTPAAVTAEPRWPLGLALCQDCGLTQLAHETPGAAPAAAAPSEGGPLIVLRHTLSRAPDPSDFLVTVHDLLSPAGLAVIEEQHLAGLVAQTAFDLIQHRYRCYFSLGALLPLLARCGLRAVDVDPKALPAGRLVLHAVRADHDREPSRQVRAAFQAEERLQLADLATWAAFARRLDAARQEVLTFLDESARYGQTLAGYGATPRANALLAACGVDRDRLPYVVDPNPDLHGLRTPGHDLPIYSPEYLLGDRPDVTLVLTWAEADTVSRQLLEYRRRGGRVAAPLPVARLISVAA